MMDDLLASIIHAHRGMDLWSGYEKVDATIVSGGGFFPLKGVLQDSAPRHMTVWLHEERSSVLMRLLKQQAGAYGSGVEYAYTMVHEAPQSAQKPQVLPKKAH